MHRLAGMYVPPFDLFALGAKGLLKDAMGGRADADVGTTKPAAAMEAAVCRRASRRVDNDGWYFSSSMLSELPSSRFL